MYFTPGEITPEEQRLLDDLGEALAGFTFVRRDWPEVVELLQLCCPVLVCHGWEVAGEQVQGQDEVPAGPDVLPMWGNGPEALW
jgi:hypothetical protein